MPSQDLPSPLSVHEPSCEPIRRSMYLQNPSWVVLPVTALGQKHLDSHGGCGWEPQSTPGFERPPPEEPPRQLFGSITILCGV